MRKPFVELLYREMSINENIVVLTADLGYGMFDTLRRDYPDRFYNVGSSEQLMIGMAVGMAMEHKIPVCYSITPFLLYRPFEFIRNYLNHEKFPVKLVGGGRNQDYGYLGFTHWADDDFDIMKELKNITFYKPIDDDELKKNFPEFINSNEPAYINLKK